MKRLASIVSVFFASLFLVVGLLAIPTASADEAYDADVQAVEALLKQIDSLQQMQDKRSDYTVRKAHYDSTTTDSAVAAEHEAARAAYETYVSEMFAARAAAREAYDALDEAQQAQVNPALVSKLADSLSTVLNKGTYAVSPRSDAYAFEAVEGGAGFGYEVSNHMVAGNIPQTFILVDTSNGATEWTPSGEYVYGESNYDVAYCCDVETAVVYTTDYRRVNLEDSSYYGEDAARHVRAILENSYPFVSIDEMKAMLLDSGLSESFVSSLTRADIIAAVQMAIWSYANGDIVDSGYFASVSVTKNTGLYFTPLHDYTNECWDWLPGKRQRSYDARAAYRVNNLAYYLCTLPGAEATEDQVVVSDIEVARADMVKGADGLYSVGMYVYVDGAKSGDSLRVTATSYSTEDDGAAVRTDRVSQRLSGDVAQLSVQVKEGDTVEVVVEGTQQLSRGVYLYEPEGGRDVSQTLVGVAEGATPVRASKAFSFDGDVEMGLRIYKTAVDSRLPLSGITFNVYRADAADGAALGEALADELVAEIAASESLAGSVVTDDTGYACLALEAGEYLVVEEHDAEKVKAPVDPFFIQVPTVNTISVTDADTGVEAEVVQLDVVSVYPKNEPVDKPDDSVEVPVAPDNVMGAFTVLKHDASDESLVLEGAQFQVYREVAGTDEGQKIVYCEGSERLVAPVLHDGVDLILTTGEGGLAVSPELTCGTYYLVEMKAPVGYNLLDEAVKVVVNPSVMEDPVVICVPNERGLVIPETGGTGTFAVYAAGALLVILAVAGIVIRRRQA